MELTFKPQTYVKRLSVFLCLIAFVIVMFPLSVRAADPPLRASDRFINSPGAQEYPEACAIILEDDLTYQLNEDYSAVATEHNAVKILNENGVRLFKIAPRPFDASCEKIEFQYARTITPEGEVLEVPQENIKTIQSIVGAPMYESRKIKAAEFPGVRVGSIVEYSIKTTYAPREDKQWWACSYLQNDLPILHSTYKVSVPSKVKAYTFTNLPYMRSPKVTEENGKRTYYWSTKEAYNVIPSNVSMPASINYYKYVAASSFADWKELAAWIGNCWEKETADRNASLSMISSRITSVGKPADKRIKDILGYMSKFSILDKDGEFWRSINLKEASSSRFLTYPDAAYLTGALLKRAGLRVTPYMSTSSDLNTIAELPPIPTYVNQFFLKVSDPGGKTWWIDPTLPGAALSAPNLGWQGSAMLELPVSHSSKPGRLIAAPVGAPEDNIGLYNMEGRIETTGIGQLSADITYNGPRANILRTASAQAQTLSDSQRKEVTNWIVNKFDTNFCFQTIPYSHFFPNDIDNDQPVTLGTSVQFANYARYNRDKKYFETPLPIISSQSLQAGLNTSSRTYPVRFDAPFVDEITYRLILPEGSQVVNQPQDISLSNEVGSYSCKTVVKNSEVWFYSRTEIKEAWLYKEKFAQLEELARAQLETFRSPLAYTLSGSKAPNSTESSVKTSEEASEQP
ncbi:MAG: DUF3857 domain-containing protein [Candidatus Bruticola sp.]